MHVVALLGQVIFHVNFCTGCFSSDPWRVGCVYPAPMAGFIPSQWPVLAAFVMALVSATTQEAV